MALYHRACKCTLKGRTCVTPLCPRIDSHVVALHVSHCEIPAEESLERGGTYRDAPVRPVGPPTCKQMHTYTRQPHICIQTHNTRSITHGFSISYCNLRGHNIIMKNIPGCCAARVAIHARNPETQAEAPASGELVFGIIDWVLLGVGNRISCWARKRIVCCNDY